MSKEKQKENWINKYGKKAHWGILEIFTKPYYYILISKKFRVSERTAKRWQSFLKNDTY